MIIYTISLIGVISNEKFGFPYNSNQDNLAQKRLFIMKTERKFESLFLNKDHSEKFRNRSDSGFYILRYENCNVLLAVF